MIQMMHNPITPPNYYQQAPDPMFFALPAAPPALHVPFPPPPAAPPVLPAVQRVKLPRRISLTEFSEHYFLDDQDHDDLKKLGYVPGDVGITTLETTHWEMEKISPLGRARLLRYHNEFLSDVQAGGWD
jgi:hypothetical protein